MRTVVAGGALADGKLAATFYGVEGGSWPNVDVDSGTGLRTAHRHSPDAAPRGRPLA